MSVLKVMKNQKKLLFVANTGIAVTVLLIVLFSVMFPNIQVGSGADEMLEKITTESSFEAVQRRSLAYVSLLLSATKMSNNLVLLLFLGLCVNGILLFVIQRMAKSQNVD